MAFILYNNINNNNNNYTYDMQYNINFSWNAVLWGNTWNMHQNHT